MTVTKPSPLICCATYCFGCNRTSSWLSSLLGCINQRYVSEAYLKPGASARSGPACRLMAHRSRTRTGSCGPLHNAWLLHSCFDLTARKPHPPLAVNPPNPHRQQLNTRCFSCKLSRHTPAAARINSQGWVSISRARSPPRPRPRPRQPSRPSSSTLMPTRYDGATASTLSPPLQPVRSLPQLHAAAGRHQSLTGPSLHRPSV
jgi:hypothetical protein